MPEFDILGTLGVEGTNFLSAGRVATIAFILFAALVIIGLIGILAFFIVRKRLYYLVIPVYKKVGNRVTRVGTYRARTVPIGRAGDLLWYVAGAKKYLPPGTIQSANNEYWFYIREDGEWINFGMDDLDEIQRQMGAKFVHQDMRMVRLGIDRLLEQRLMNQSFWQKWGTTIMSVVFFLILAISLTLYLYMFGKNLEQISTITERLDSIIKGSGGASSGQLVPAAFGALLPSRWVLNIKKRWRNRE